jgi:NADH-quinone oxidoreductase subunit N
MNVSNYLSAAPEMTLLGLLCIVLVVDLFVDDEHRKVTFWLSMVSLAITMWVLFATAPAARTVVFSGAYVSDALSQAMKISVVGFVAIAFL